MGEQCMPSNTQTHEANIREQTTMPQRIDGAKECQQGGHPYGFLNTGGDSTSPRSLDPSVSIYSAAARRGNFDPAVAGSFNTYDTESEGGIRVLKRLEQVSEVRSTAQMDSIYTNNEEIQDPLQAGLSRGEVAQEFGVPVDRKERRETEPNIS